jgi:hypothetical protein
MFSSCLRQQQKNYIQKYNIEMCWVEVTKNKNIK